MSTELQVRHRAVCRNRFLAAFCGVFVVVVLLVCAIVLPGPGQHGAYVGGAVLSTVSWAMWVLGWWTKVAVKPDGVVIDNVIVCHVIPAAQFGGFELGSGLLVRTKDNRRFGLFGYGGSVLGEITRYRSQRRVLVRMETAAAMITDNADPQARVRTYIKIPWWPYPPSWLWLKARYSSATTRYEFPGGVAAL